MKFAAVTFPTPYTLLRRIFEQEKNVYIKNSLFKHINNKMKIIFYASQEIHAFIGQADIESVEFLSINNLIDKYGDKVFLKKEEIYSYAKGTRSRNKPVYKFLVLTLTNIIKYQNYIDPPHFVSMLGRYINKEEFEKIFQNGSK